MGADSVVVVARVVHKFGEHLSLETVPIAVEQSAMIYVVVEELIPESQTNERKDVMALFTLIGFSVMMVLDVALG